MLRGDFFEILTSCFGIKLQRLPLLHQNNFPQLNLQIVLIELHPRVPAVHCCCVTKQSWKPQQSSSSKQLGNHVVSTISQVKGLIKGMITALHIWSCHTHFMFRVKAHANCNTLGRKTAPYPAAHAILPQFGSCPKMAALVREDAAMDLAILAAALSSGAPKAVTSSRQVAPSPSHAIDFAKP